MYGYGVFKGSRTQLESAVSLAYDTYGTVVDSDSKLVWKRYKSTQASIDGVVPVINGNSLTNSIQMLCNYLGGDVNALSHMNGGMDAVDIISSINGVNGINLTGITYDKILSYIGEGSPVIARIGDNQYIVIIAYNSNEIAYIDGETGVQKTITMNDAGKMFSEGGNVYVTYYK